ncbi:hypothetical protein [Pontivivens ytuae]|uniref:Molybdopterin-dependent oxidoreductase n=1 Tax=Pontivivens ytuae TaxID=2789856 RepID=A0A7S9LPH8_9RHOB|nr:hypothetical protein [Pontivivens ytuae]QPH52706.1 hypothetical protein I0K15_12890 [Pontivivens ytuae]
MRTALSIAALLFALPAAAEMAAPTGQVILTVGGEIGQGNRGPSTADDLSVLGKMELVFEEGASFDMDMLAALPQAEIVTNMPGTEDQPATFSGPLLSDVMVAVGAEGRAAYPMALDGYSVEIPWEEMVEHGPILATHVDGTPLPIGGIGPTMTVYPQIEDAALYEEFLAKQVWATFYLGVE